MSKLLFNEVPLVVLPELARAIGLEESILLQQIHYWELKMGRPVYNSYADWQKQFPWMSTRTIRRVLESLEQNQLILTTIDTADGNKKSYGVNHDNELMKGQTSVQNGQTSVQFDHTFQATENTQRNNTRGSAPIEPATTRPSRLVIDKSSELWKDYEAWIAWWNKQRGQRRAANDNDFKNFQYWREKYDLLDMKVAIVFMRYDSYWGSENVAPGVMLRQFLKDKQTPCDHFGDFLSIRQPGNPDVEGLRSDYMKVRTWFDNGQPLDQLTEVLMTLKHFGYDELVAELAQKAKEAQHVS